MLVVDRYVSLLFAKIFMICFVSFAGLYIVIDAFTNLEEFLQLGKTGGGFLTVVSGYYAPRILQLFDRTSAMVALVACIFGLTLMQRANELTAIQAAGISRRRIAWPALVAGMIVIVAAAANRELLIPTFRNQLTTNPQDLTGGKERAVYYSVDHETGIVIGGKSAKPAEGTVFAPEFILPDALASLGKSIRARSAQFCQAGGKHPQGYLLSDTQGAPTHSQQLNGQPLLLAPAENPWLKPRQLFVCSGVTIAQLSFGPEMLQFASLSELIRSTWYPTARASVRHRVDIHARLTRPILDLTVLLIGIPLVVSRRERNLFVSAGICLLIVITITLMTMGCYWLGAVRMIAPPALAAWLPLILFLPIAAVTIQLLDQ